MNSFNQNIHDIFNQAFREKSNKAFIVFENRTISYGDLKKSIGKYTTYLHNSGIKKGDRIVFSSRMSLLYASLPFLLLQMGSRWFCSILMVGAIVQMLLSSIVSRTAYLLMKDYVGSGVSRIPIQDHLSPSSMKVAKVLLISSYVKRKSGPNHFLPA